MSTLLLAVLTLTAVAAIAAVTTLAVLLSDDGHDPIDWTTPTPCPHGLTDCPTCGAWRDTP